MFDKFKIVYVEVGDLVVIVELNFKVSDNLM